MWMMISTSSHIDVEQSWPNINFYIEVLMFVHICKEVPSVFGGFCGRYTLAHAQQKIRSLPAIGQKILRMCWSLDAQSLRRFWTAMWMTQGTSSTPDQRLEGRGLKSGPGTPTRLLSQYQHMVTEFQRVRHTGVIGNYGYVLRLLSHLVLQAVEVEIFHTKIYIPTCRFRCGIKNECNTQQFHTVIHIQTCGIECGS